MTQATVPGYVYTVYTAEGCTVTAPGFPSFSVTCSPGMANSFTAPGDKVEISDPDATLVAVRTFNGALAALGLLGEGNILPAGYKRLEYLESTGTQYINTGIYPTSESYLNFLFASTNKSQSVVNVAGARDGYPINMFSVYLSTDYRLRYGRLQVQGIPRKEEQIYSILLGRYTVVNGSPVDNFKGEPDFTVSSPLWLFGSSEKGVQIDELFIGRIYEAKLYDSVETSGHFIPALDQTGAPCMFDTVSRTAFYNSGTGDFVTPPTGATTYGLRRVLPDWGKLTPTGLRRLYHVPEGYQGDALQYAAENGFCPIQEEPQPEEGFWAPKWEEVGGVICLRWVEAAPPEEN